MRRSQARPANPRPAPIRHRGRRRTFDYRALFAQADSSPRIPIQAPGMQLGACCGRNGRSKKDSSDMKKAVLALATAATIGVTALVAPSPAQAWRGGWGPGLAGGLIAGAVIGGIASSAYAYDPGYGYYGGPGYGDYGGQGYGYYGGDAPAYYGGDGPAYYNYGYAPAYYGGYRSSYYAPAYYGPRYRRVVRPAYW